MNKFPIQIIIIDDDPEMESRPLYKKLVNKYGKENLVWIDEPKEGLEYVKNSLTKMTIVILDYDFGSSKFNGVNLFQELQKESSLLYIILNTAKGVDDISKSELKVLINNHLMGLVDKAIDGYNETLNHVEKAIAFLNFRVDSVLEQWILRHEQFKQETPFIKDVDGKIYKLKDVLSEIRKDTPFGKKIVSKIISTAITILQGDIDKQENQT